MKNIFLTMVTALFINGAYAQEAVADKQLDEAALRPIIIRDNYEIKPGDTKIIPLPRYTYIDRMSIEVKTGFLCSEDSFRVSFDGYSSQNVNFKGWPSGYRTRILHVDANARNIEVYNSTNCKLRIKEIEVLPRRFSAGRGHGPGQVYMPATEAGAQVSFLLETLLYLDQLVGDADRVQYISPAKKTLGRALSVLNTSPETSQASLQAIRDVLNYLKAARPFIEKLSTIEATFDAAQEIQSVEASLSRMIR